MSQSNASTPSFRRKSRSQQRVTQARQVLVPILQVAENTSAAFPPLQAAIGSLLALKDVIDVSFISS
jgi:hypothetical protein